MKILNLRFKNLNSLYGEWTIDFTDPQYTSNGIFAITGQTGAGNQQFLMLSVLLSTGRPPRLGNITTTSNDIMSSQQGDCFSQVTFQSQAGTFRCHWSQHRARGAADGKLQPAKHEICDALTDTVLTAKKTHVLKEVERCTGMDFDRFTRSMMLAQGGFAAFLQASGDERAPVLEQITGTGIYSEISIAVHLRKSEELRKLELLQAETGGIPPSLRGRA